jgi:hypothetical protein
MVVCGIMPKKDLNQTATNIMRLTTGQSSSEQEKNPAAVALGRLGGLKGGKARAERMSATRRREVAKKAAEVRWRKREN